jgi:hypothetical protein
MHAIREALEAVRLGEPRTVARLTLFPLLGEEKREPGYLSLEEAIEAKVAKVTEISEGGRVPELLFVNEGDRPVLLVDGAALVGAKQNRILNLTILAPPRSHTAIPVSCVEAGRWARRSAEFTTADHYMFAAARAAKMDQVSGSLRTAGRALSDQGAVWDSIAAKMASLGGHSPSSDMTEIFRQYKAKLDDIAGSFEAADGQAGVVIGLADRIAGVDLFDSGTTLRRYLGKIVRSYGLDAIDLRGGGDGVPREAAERFLDEVATAQAERYPAIGLGEDVRLTAPGLAGGALVVDGRVVHLAAFRARAS